MNTERQIECCFCGRLAPVAKDGGLGSHRLRGGGWCWLLADDKRASGRDIERAHVLTARDLAMLTVGRRGA